MQQGSGVCLQLAAAIVLLLVCLPITSAASHVKDGICPSIEVRQDLSQLKKLQGCTVVEGNLNMVLFEWTKYSELENISFPELREVTGYILIYRFKSLRNLGDMFPNLAVVRGLTLFRDFSVIISDNMDLQALGLRSLVKIERGAVRIERNDKLCYIDTVDWSKVVAAGTNNVIRKNYESRFCGPCPSGIGGSQQCSVNSGGRVLCWDDRHCQKLCSACGDRACASDGSCCDRACLGGCDGPSPHDCHVCRHFSFGYGANRTCVDRCPANTYEFLRRCVTEFECRNSTPPISSHHDRDRQKPYKTFNGTCIQVCPIGYKEVGQGTDARCEPCPQGVCVVNCTGGIINSISAAERFKGCTHVEGSIDISLRTNGARTMTELEELLGGIREITGVLKVTRSAALISLSFFKSLRKIGGQETKQPGQESVKTGKTSQTFHIFSNPNLEMLWNWTTHGPIEITHGKLFIHFNPKLCYRTLVDLKTMTKDNESTFDSLEVSPESNGDQISCNQESLNLQVTELKTTLVTLKWNPYCIDDSRKLLGYSLYYIATENNITQYDRRNACYDSWQVIDKTQEEILPNASVSPVNQLWVVDPCAELQPLFQVVNGLQPFTRYASYVKTYTSTQAKRGAHSPIIYFRTLPGQPSSPEKVNVDVEGPHSATIRWSQPKAAKGILTKYRLLIQLNSYNREIISQYKYCTNPNALSELQQSVRKSDSADEKDPYHPSSTGDVKDETCSCAADVDNTSKTRFTVQLEEEQEESADFENALQNEVYVKSNTTDKLRRYYNSLKKRPKRSTDNKMVIDSHYSNPSIDDKLFNITDGGYIKTLYDEVPVSKQFLSVTNLRHSSWYTVSVWACRSKHENEESGYFNNTWCSIRQFTYFWTLEMPNVDIVTDLRAEVITSNKTLPEVNVTWNPPENPNGIIVAYNVYHTHVEEDGAKQDGSSQRCISAEDYESSGRSFVLRNLAPGNYSIRVAAVSAVAAVLPAGALRGVWAVVPAGGERSWRWAAAVAAGCVLVLLLLALGAWLARRSLLSSQEGNKLFASVNPEYVATVYVPDDWEVPRSDIELIRELGQGSFGMVYEGIARNIVKGDPETRCAVKTVNEHATDRERMEFLNEASVMKAFDTHHVVRLLGVVSRGQPTLVVMELMACGDLKSYLREQRPDAPTPRPPTLLQIQQMAIEIADGMAYLSAKKFVHRDLAARNCMVAGDLTVKVGDFGMTRDIYETDYYRKGSKGLLPVRWMSPESLKDGVFSSSSDIWSFGVVLWEMATLAMQPYQGLSNEQVLRYVVEGGVMERPEHCPDRLYELMRACWAHRPEQRPTFMRLVADLAPTAATYFRQRSFFHSPQGQEIYNQQKYTHGEEELDRGVDVGAVVTGSGSNLFGVSGRLASWVRELSSLRSRDEDDAAAQPLDPRPATTPC